ncbi:hypothetical protein [Flammeovirga sp. SJP92]|uniref:hypothetical protein n=1 Tax=Flammeovirga sp. SJP92 TaxID=1775430 RepID=UPI0007894F19|nr:hypothetical protein [Flammeovirga sp. SJP92]KXX72129.1 hypothetical protein AVL50_02615 [Flammeovirga sp. SJP92]
MNTILTLLIVLNIFSDHNGIGRIAEANKQKSAGEEAFIAKDYKTAIDAYTILLDSMKIEDDAAMLDLAHSYFLSEDKENATKRYASIQNSANKKIASIANQQLGVLKAQEQKLEEALAFLKAAMKHDPQNMGARYDYEMLLKQKKEQEEQEQQNQDQNQDQNDENQDKQDQQDQQDQNQDQNDQNQDQEQDQDENQEQQDQQEGDQKDNKDQKDSQNGDQKEGDQEENQEQEGEQGEETEEERKEREKAEEQANFNNRMEEIKMPASQAQMILDALKNKEVQYFQQQKKKSKKQDRNKPDW